MTNCNKYEYPESITPTDISDHLVVQYDSFSEITQPDPNHIYIIDGTAYVFDGTQYISIGVACETYETYEGDTEVTTQDADIVLSTNGKLMNSDITIHHGHDIEDAILQGTAMDEYVNNRITTLYDYSFFKTNIRVIRMENVATISERCFSNSSVLEELYLPGLTGMGGICVRDNTALKVVDFGKGISDWKMTNNPCLDTVILRNTSVYNATTATFGSNTPFTKSTGTGGYVYVPQALLSAYQAATSWQTYANVLEFRAIEGSIYE